MKQSSFLKNNSLSIVLISLTIIVLWAQSISGNLHYNEERMDEGQAPASYPEYLTSGHFIESVFENWESEFLQMGLYVLLTVFLIQKGSSESKDPEKSERVDKIKYTHTKDTPYPVKKGGLHLWLYENSLFLAFMVLFLISFYLHAVGGADEYNRENLAKGNTEVLTTFQYMGTSLFWFESFQNWQSEFLAVFAIVVLSIFLRQKGSPESKPVDAPHSQTGA
jgi:hypothetical protein